jgi:hypothetical protein
MYNFKLLQIIVIIPPGKWPVHPTPGSLFKRSLRAVRCTECKAICDAMSLWKSPKSTFACFKFNFHTRRHSIDSRLHPYASYIHAAPTSLYVPFYRSFFFIILFRSLRMFRPLHNSYRLLETYKKIMNISGGLSSFFFLFYSFCFITCLAQGPAFQLILTFASHLNAPQNISVPS